MKKIKKIITSLSSVYQNKATEYLETEISELEYMFNTVTTGFLTGQAVVPVHISLSLLKDISPLSLDNSANKAYFSTHPLSYLFSVFDIA